MGYKPTFSSLSAILDSFAYAYSAIADKFRGSLSLSWEALYSAVLSLVCACLTNSLVKVVAILGVIKPCPCSYTRMLRFLILRTCAYLDSLGKFSFRAWIGLRTPMSGSGQVRACDFGFGLQIGARLELSWLRLKTRCFILCEKKHEWICSSASTSLKNPL